MGHIQKGKASLWPPWPRPIGLHSESVLEYSPLDLGMRCYEYGPVCAEALQADSHQPGPQWNAAIGEQSYQTESPRRPGQLQHYTAGAAALSGARSALHCDA